jgi:hypothetical protein
MKNILGLILMMSILSFWGQKETLVFNISKPESLIEISTADTVFRQGERNIFMVSSTGGKKITSISVFGSKVFTIRPGLYEVSFEKPGLTYIKVMVLNEKGVPEIGTVEKIEVLGLPQVNLFLCGTKADSALDIKHLIEVRKVVAVMKDKSFDYHPVVTSFKLRMKQDTFKINGDMIPFELKSKMYDLQPGDPLELIETRVMLPDANKNIIIVPNFTVFLVNSDQHTIGERKYINPAE